MYSILSPETAHADQDRPSGVAVVQPWLARLSVRQALRSLYHATWTLARWNKKLAFFLLPPLVYVCLKWVMPRFVQAPARRQFLEAMERRIAPPSEPSDPQVPPTAIETVVNETVIDESSRHVDRYRAVHLMRESGPALLEAKLDQLAELYRGQLFDRVRLLREMARLVSLRGQGLLSCAYRVRAIRLLGTDAYRDLPMLRRTLEDLNFAAESEALAAMYEDPARAPERCQELLENALANHRSPPASIAFEKIEDRRHVEIPRVAVIVSLYNAADKLPLFLHSLHNQSLLHTNQLEFLFIDSGSPLDEYSSLTQTLTNFSLPYLYVRTADRETIQTAWNRGISLARAPYLTFLGVDEAVIPDALAVLADALDADPSVNWVQGDSLLTEVDRQGCWTRDIMTYDREGYTQNHVYLETCYLSWVGAMYRRSIHERFGYYDGSFRATGDNEFKCRILPFIKTQRIPRLLGLFLNYPETRATGSPVAELEDIRAWYLHRTLAGVRYAMQGRDPCELEKMLLLSLCYRKSYTTHFSSDVEYAAHAAAHLREIIPTSPLLSLSPGIRRMLNAVRTHDHPDLGAIGGFLVEIDESSLTWASVQEEHRKGPWLKDVEYRVDRDNRHEQHAFLYG